MGAYYASGIVLGTLCILLNHPDKLRYPDATNNIIPFCRGEKGEQTSEVPWTRSENLWQLGAGPSLHGYGIRSCSCFSTRPCQSPLLPTRTSAPSYRSQPHLLPLLPSFIANKWFSRKLLCRLCSIENTKVGYVFPLCDACVLVFPQGILRTWIHFKNVDPFNKVGNCISKGAYLDWLLFLGLHNSSCQALC